MNIKACIFDLDGVIVDTAVYHFKAWQSIASSLGFDFTHDMNEKLKGISRIDSLNMMLEMVNIHKTDQEKDKLCKVKNTYYLDSLNDMDESAILPGITQLLETLESREIKIALGSASKNALKVLELIGLKEKFEIIVDGNGVTRSKPDPEVFLNGAKGLGVQPNESIVFEDSLKGLEAAISGGFRTVGIGTAENLPLAEVVYGNLSGITFDDILAALN